MKSRHNARVVNHAADFGGGVPRKRAFTLIEMIVVIAIIAILTAIVVPAASQMWEQRKIASSETLIKGLLQSALARAARPDGADTGIFFYVDPRGTQRMSPI